MQLPEAHLKEMDMLMARVKTGLPVEMRRRVHKWGIDPKRVGVIGFSAGASSSRIRSDVHTVEHTSDINGQSSVKYLSRSADRKFRAGVPRGTDTQAGGSWK